MADRDELEELRAEMEALKQTITEQGATLADQTLRLENAAPPPAAVVVNVKAPLPSLRLGTYTGLAPKGGQD